MKKLFFILACLIPLTAFSQVKPKYIYMQLSDKSVSLTPFYKVFGSSFDPAISFGGGIEYKQKGPSIFLQEVQGSWHSAQLIGGGISISTSIGYRYQLETGLFTEAMLGVGGTSFISGRETYSLDESGQYGQVTPVHWTAGILIDLGLGYRFGQYGVFCRYRYMLEGRYTDILPILPTSMLSLGVRYELKVKSEE